MMLSTPNFIIFLKEELDELESLNKKVSLSKFLANKSYIEKFATVGRKKYSRDNRNSDYLN